MNKNKLENYKDRVIASVEDENKKHCPYKIIILLTLAISLSLNILFGIWCGLYFTIKEENSKLPLTGLKHMESLNLSSLDKR